MYPPDFELESTMSIAARISSWGKKKGNKQDYIRINNYSSAIYICFTSKKEIYCERGRITCPLFYWQTKDELCPSLTLLTSQTTFQKKNVNLPSVAAHTSVYLPNF